MSAGLQAPDRAGRWADHIARLMPWYVLTRTSGSAARAGFTLVGGFLAIGVIGTAAMLSGWPLVFPSLGPSAFLVFWRPSTPDACPRTVLFGHSIALICGWLALFLTGLTDAGPVGVEGISTMRVLAAGLSLALVSGLMVLLKCVHTPGASTALIVSLGMMTRPAQMLAVIGAAASLCALAYLMNRLAGVYYPIWRCRDVAHRDGVVARALVAELPPVSGPPGSIYSALANDLVTSRPTRRRARRVEVDPRQPIRVTIAAPLGADPTRAALWDISISGIGILVERDGDRSWKKSDRVEVSFHLPGSEEALCFVGDVRHRLLADAGVRYGIRFESEGTTGFERQQERVRKYVLERGLPLRDE